MSQFISSPGDGVVKVPSAALLPTHASNGALALALDTDVLYVFNGTSWTVLAGGGGGGTVTSVALTAPTDVFNVSGSPVTGAGTLALSFDNQAANTVFSGPTTGAPATPAFRAQVPDDVPFAWVTGGNGFLVDSQIGLTQNFSLSIIANSTPRIIIDVLQPLTFIAGDVKLGGALVEAANTGALWDDTAKEFIVGDRSIITSDFHAAVFGVNDSTDPVTLQNVGVMGLSKVTNTGTGPFTVNSIGFHSDATMIIPLGETSNGALVGNFASVKRRDATDAGTLGLAAGYIGSYETANNANRVTNAYASFVAGFHQFDTDPGTVGGFADFLAISGTIPPGVVTGPRYGIFLQPDINYTKENWISGTAQLGGSSYTTPTETVHVDGNLSTAKTVVDGSLIGIESTVVSDTTVSASNTIIAFQANATATVQAGQENDKALSGYILTVERGDGTDDGILDGLFGSVALVFNNSGAGGVTNVSGGYDVQLITQGGTVTDHYDYRSQRAPAGGTLTNHYGVYISNDSTTPVKNWLSGATQLDGSSFSLTADCSLDVAGNRALRLPRLDTATRDALVAATGMEIYNTDSNAVEFYNGTMWTSGGGSIGPFTAGSVLFSDGTNVVEDNANFFWDETNKVLKVGVDLTDSTGTHGLIVGRGTGATMNLGGEADLMFGAAESGTSMSTTAGFTGQFIGGHANASSGGMTTANDGSAIYGYVENGSMSNSGAGTLVVGFARSGSCSLSANSQAHGSLVTGAARDASSSISAEAEGVLVGGRAAQGATITASGRGSIAHAYAEQSGTVVANGDGAQAFGRAVSSGEIRANGIGAFASGSSQGSSSIIIASSTGSMAFGRIVAGGSINADAAGAIAMGFSAAGNIVSSNVGSLAIGTTDTGGTLTASGAGAVAHGVCSTNNITASGEGSLAIGRVVATNDINVSGNASVVMGIADTQAYTVSSIAALASGDSHQVSGDLSTTHGQAHLNASFAATILGRFGAAAGSAGSWVSTDPLLVLGNGTAVGSEASALQVDKDGKLTQTAAEKNTAIRSVSANASISSRTDNTILVDTNAAAGNVTLTLPAGENGLTYIIKDQTNNATVRNILFATTGGDTIESGANIVLSTGFRVLKFFSGNWYIIGR